MHVGAVASLAALAAVTSLGPLYLTGVAAVAALLLIAVVNVAAILLARAGARGRELALRASLGARRGRLVGQLLTESLCLCMAGVCRNGWANA